MNPFEMTLLALLQDRAKQDSLFAETLKKPNKSIAECAKYIYGELAEEARKNKDGQTACVGVPKADVIAMAVHYFDEDDIKIKPINAVVKADTSKFPKSPKKDAPKAEAKKEEKKPSVKKNPILEAISKSKPSSTKKADKPKVVESAKAQDSKDKKESKKKEKANDFVGSLFDF